MVVFSDVSYECLQRCSYDSCVCCLVDRIRSECSVTVSFWGFGKMVDNFECSDALRYVQYMIQVLLPLLCKSMSTVCNITCNSERTTCSSTPEWSRFQQQHISTQLSCVCCVGLQWQNDTQLNNIPHVLMWLLHTAEVCAAVIACCVSIKIIRSLTLIHFHSKNNVPLLDWECLLPY